MKTEQQKIHDTVQKAVVEIMEQMPELIISSQERLKDFATICVMKGMRLGIEESKTVIKEGVKV